MTNTDQAPKLNEAVEFELDDQDLEEVTGGRYFLLASIAADPFEAISALGSANEQSQAN